MKKMKQKHLRLASVEGLLWQHVKLLDHRSLNLYTWRWLYKNPEATPEMLRDEMLSDRRRLYGRQLFQGITLAKIPTTFLLHIST